MSDIFCKILNKELPTTVVAENDNWIAINDIRPQAPTHVLIFSKKHIAGIEEATVAESGLLGEMLLAANDIARKKGLNGFRIIINSGEDSERGVDHLHMHMLGGKKLGAKIVN